MNRSENTTRSLSDSRWAQVDADLTFREVGGKTGRTIYLSGGTSYDETGGESAENTLLTVSGIQDVRSMTYQSDGRTSSLNGRIRYTEPLGKKWTLSTSANLDWSRRNRVRDAFDPAGRNDYYSSVSRSRPRDRHAKRDVLQELWYRGHHRQGPVVLVCGAVPQFPV